MQHTSIPLTLAFGPQGCMAEVKGRVVAVWCRDEVPRLFCGGLTFLSLSLIMPDREAATVIAWLQALKQGAPQAIQVADRYHLLVNLREHLKSFLDHKRTSLPKVEGEHNVLCIFCREKWPMMRN